MEVRGSRRMGTQSRVETDPCSCSQPCGLGKGWAGESWRNLIVCPAACFCSLSTFLSSCLSKDWPQGHPQEKSRAEGKGGFYPLLPTKKRAVGQVWASSPQARGCLDSSGRQVEGSSSVLSVYVLRNTYLFIKQD